MKNSNSQITIQSSSYIQRKFTFSDLNLAFKVRATVFQALKQFDTNLNGLFQQNELKTAMVHILGQSQSQVHYSVKNIFRYDKNRDGLVTYDQFTNFSVEQHFGEMAIQRLHRTGFYSRGANRMMNSHEFQKTLNYCFNFIKVSATTKELQHLFKEVDIDKDGYISYEDYFVFLREYFGSKSQAYEVNLAKEKTVVIPSSIKITHQQTPKRVRKVYPPGESPSDRLAKLIYSQLRVSLIEFDKKQKLIIEPQQVKEALSKIFKYSYQQQQEFTRIKIKQRQHQEVPYENLLRKLCIFSLCKNKTNTIKQDMKLDQFKENLCRNLFFIEIKPGQKLLTQLFEEFTTGHSLSKEQYLEVMENILSNYKFDKRGLRGYH